MMTDTATIKAATATAVRLMEVTTLRGAMRPNAPHKRPKGRVATRISTKVTSGVNAAKAITTEKVPAKLMVRLRVGTANKTIPLAAKTKLPTATLVTARRALPSKPERDRATRAGTEAASHAGGAAANNVATTPNSAPFTKLEVAISISCTVTTK
jgi:hypothetical protein